MILIGPLRLGRLMTRMGLAEELSDSVNGGKEGEGKKLVRLAD